MSQTRFYRDTKVKYQELVQKFTFPNPKNLFKRSSSDGLKSSKTMQFRGSNQADSIEDLYGEETSNGVGRDRRSLSFDSHKDFKLDFIQKRFLKRRPTTIAHPDMSVPKSESNHLAKLKSRIQREAKKSAQVLIAPSQTEKILQPVSAPTKEVVIVEVPVKPLARRVHFHETKLEQVTSYAEYEDYDDVFVRVAGFASYDTRPNHKKVRDLLLKSITYLNYKDSPCAEVFALTSSEITMWRLLAGHDWDSNDDGLDELTNESSIDSDDSFFSSSRVSESSDGPISDDSSDSEYENNNNSPELPGVDASKDLSTFHEIVNSCINFGDFMFEKSHIYHLCSVGYPNTEDEDDGWL